MDLFTRYHKCLWVAPLVAIPLLVQVLLYRPSEPFFNNDETRHLMTGVFFRDALLDLPVQHFREYAVQYYLQYPALGLLVWPPLFYLVEGAVMSVVGVSFLNGKIVVLCFLVIALVYLFRLIRMRHQREVAVLAVILCGISPLTVEFSQHVMLEIPTLAFSLMSIYHFECYLQNQRSRSAIFATLSAALAALTRFDAVFLLAFFFLRLSGTRKIQLLLRRPVLAGAGLAILLTCPYYLFTFREYGGAISKAAAEGTNPEASVLFGLRNFVYYPSVVPEQVGWAMTVVALVGLLGMIRTAAGRSAGGPFLALAAATYITFTPLAELESRHAIYWIPALTFFASLVCCRVPGNIRFRWVPFGLTAAVGGATLAVTLSTPVFHVFGYEAAATYVLEHSKTRRVCLMDGFLNGGFIYHIRIHDPQRSMWTIRGDKVFYSMLSDPHGGYEERTATQSAILELIESLDPEYIVLEEPQLYFQLPAAGELRKLIRSRTDLFQLEKTIEIQSNHFRFKGGTLQIYRKLHRNPNAPDSIEIQMMSLGKSIRTRIQ